MNFDAFKAIITLILIVTSIAFTARDFANAAPDNLVIVTETTPLFSSSNLSPGNKTTKWVDITNNKPNSEQIGIQGANLTDTGSLANDIEFSISDSGSVLYTDNFASFFTAGEISLKDISASATERLFLTLDFKSNSGNQNQGQSIGFDLIFGFIEPEDAGNGGGGGVSATTAGSGGGGGGLYFSPDQNGEVLGKTITASDIKITKYPNLDLVTTDELIIYTLKYENLLDDVLDVKIIEVVPANTIYSFASSTEGWSCPDNSKSGTVCEYIIGALKKGESGEVQFAVKTNTKIVSATSIVNDAYITNALNNDLDISNNHSRTITPLKIEHIVLGETVGLPSELPKTGIPLSGLIPLALLLFFRNIFNRKKS